VALPAMWWNCKLHQSLLNTKCHPIWCLPQVCTFCLCRTFMISLFWPTSRSLTLLHFGFMVPLELKTKTRPIHAFYLWRKVVCSVCQVEISQIAAPLAALLVPLESPSWFHNVWTYGGEINIEYLTIFSRRIPLNQN
jgi:hypothetical protein